MRLPHFFVVAWGSNQTPRHSFQREAASLIAQAAANFYTGPGLSVAAILAQSDL